MTSVGKLAFSGCSSLKNITIPVPTSSWNFSEVFTGCSSIESIILNGIYTVIENDSFRDLPVLKEVNIMAPVETIGSYAFSSCPKLHSIHLPYTLNKVYTGAFRYDTSLDTVYYNGSDSQWGNISIANYNEPLLNANIISRSDISWATISTKYESYVYKGTPWEPKPVVQLNGKTLVYGTDYDLTYENDLNVGTATVTAQGKGDYTGTISCTYSIIPRDISEGMVSTETETFLYTGSPINPDVILLIDVLTLIKDRDYTLTYNNNTEIGKATVTAHGIGNYEGEISGTFEIVQPGLESIAKAEVQMTSENYVYTGMSIEPIPIIQLGGKVLVNGTDYDLTYENDLNVGTATVTAHGKGDYTGTVSCTYGITPRDISEGTASTKSKSYAYKGTPRHPAMILVVNNITLVQDVDYTLDYENNIEIGTAKAIAHGIGNYTGEIFCTFEIIHDGPVSIETAEIYTKSESYVYTGTPRNPSPVITLDGKTLVKGTDYDLTYENDLNVGTATVIAHGKGAYTGTVSCTYGITPRDISEGTASTKSKTYGVKMYPKRASTHYKA